MPDTASSAAHEPLRVFAAPQVETNLFHRAGREFASWFGFGDCHEHAKAAVVGRFLGPDVTFFVDLVPDPRAAGGAVNEMAVDAVQLPAFLARPVDVDQAGIAVEGGVGAQLGTGHG